MSSEGGFVPRAAGDRVCQQRSRDRTRQSRYAEERAYRVARKIDRFDPMSRHHRPNLANHPNLEGEDLIEVHEPVRQNVENGAARICHHVERQLAPFERTPILDDFYVQSGARKRRREPVVGVGADRGEREAAAIFGGAGVSVSIAVYRRRERRRHDVIGTERRRELLLVPDAVLRRDEDAFLRIGNSRAQGFDCAVGVVGLGRDDGHVGVVRPNRREVARRVGYVDSDRTQQIAEVRTDRTPAGDVHVHEAAPVEPKPPSPRGLGGSSSTTSNSARDTGATIICAIRSPRLIRTGLVPRFASTTRTSPR